MSSSTTCRNCGGRGTKFIEQLGGGATEIACPSCGGLGEVTLPGQTDSFSPTSTRQRRSSGPYQPLLATRLAEAMIPRWLERTLGVVAAFALVAFLLQNGHLPSLSTPAGISGEAVVMAAIAGLIGYVAGANGLFIALRLIDASLKLLIVAIGTGILIGVIWLVGRILEIW